MTCRYHHGKDPRCYECAVTRVWDMYYRWCEETIQLPTTLEEAQSTIESILYDLSEALNGPRKKKQNDPR